MRTCTLTHSALDHIKNTIISFLKLLNYYQKKEIFSAKRAHLSQLNQWLIGIMDILHLNWQVYKDSRSLFLFKFCVPHTDFVMNLLPI